MIKKKCKVSSCFKKYHAKGFCSYHYYSLYWNPNNRGRLRSNYKRYYNRHRKRILFNTKKRYPKYKKTIGYKFGEYKHSANKTNKIFNLTKEEFKNFWNKPCHYCNSEIDTIGLDRVDNNIGYVIENIVSCCIRCNKMKKDMDYKQFIELCRLIANRLV